MEPLKNPEVIYGHRPCQSNEARWLCLDNIYEKLHRNNIYDIGGTYIQDVPDHWFTYKTEQVGSIFLLHIFAGNFQEGTYYIGLSNSNEFTLNKKNNIVYLSETLKNSAYTVKDKKCAVYIHTYNFTECDIEFLKGKQLYIAVEVDHETSGKVFSDEVENVKARHDCRELLVDPVGSDFVIQSEDGTKFNVHKVLLTTHSEVFKAMLREDTAESQNNFVLLVDVDTEDIRAMIEFIYTGTIQDIENVNFQSMLMLSDRYNLVGLRELSTHALAQQLSIDNALDILLIADMYDSYNLKVKAMKFIKINKDTLNSSRFGEIKNIQLMRELCNYLAS